MIQLSTERGKVETERAFLFLSIFFYHLATVVPYHNYALPHNNNPSYFLKIIKIKNF